MVLGGAACVAVCLTAVPGCSKPTQGTVSGKVTYPSPDKPVKGGQMKLIPATGTPFVIGIGLDGTYTTTNVPPGDYKVTIESAAGTGSRPAIAMDPQASKKMEEEKAKMGMGGQEESVALPEKYANANQSGLTLSVKAGKNDPKNFDLTP
jgi:hypothetical protein